MDVSLAVARELLGSISFVEGEIERLRDAPRDFPGTPVACAYVTEEWLSKARAFWQATGEE